MAVSIITIIIIIIIYIIIIYIYIIYMYYRAREVATIKKKEVQFAPPLCFSIFFCFFFLKLFRISVPGSCINNVVQ